MSLSLQFVWAQKGAVDVCESLTLYDILQGKAGEEETVRARVWKDTFAEEKLKDLSDIPVIDSTTIYDMRISTKRRRRADDPPADTKKRPHVSAVADDVPIEPVKKEAKAVQQIAEEAPKRKPGRPPLTNLELTLPKGTKIEHKVTPAGQKYKVVVLPDGKRFPSVKRALQYWDTVRPKKKKKIENKLLSVEPAGTVKQVEPPAIAKPVQNTSPGILRASPAPAHILKVEENLILPVGWTVEEKLRTAGSRAGCVDKYYISPEGERFNSMIKLRTHLDSLVVADVSLPDVVRYVGRLAQGPYDGNWSPQTSQPVHKAAHRSSVALRKPRPKK